MASEEAKKAHADMIQKNGESDWHLSASFDDDEMAQVLTIRPDYSYDESPIEGDVTLHVLHYDKAGNLAEVEISVSAAEFTRLCGQCLQLLNADQSAYENVRSHAEGDDEDDDHEDEDDELEGDDEDDDEDEDEDDDEEDDDDDEEDDDDDEEDDDNDEDETDEDEDGPQSDESEAP